MRQVWYDAGVLIAADSSDRSTWADHRTLLDAGITPTTTAPIVAQASRPPEQAQLRRFLRGCEVVGFDPADAHLVGDLLHRAKTSDVIDAHLVIAAAVGEVLMTTDPDDLAHLANLVDDPPRIDPR